MAVLIFCHFVIALGNRLFYQEYLLKLFHSLSTLICPASNSYSKNYLNHLVNSNEILGSMLLTWHNIAFYQDLMKKIRQAIKENKFEEFYKKHFELFNEVN